MSAEMKQQYTYNSMVLGKRLKSLRKKNGMTQEKLAEELTLSVDSVSNIENGKTNCMPEYIIKICQMFNVSADYLYFGIDRELSPSNSDVRTRINNILLSCKEFDLERIHDIIQILLRQP